MLIIDREDVCTFFYVVTALKFEQVIPHIELHNNLKF